MTSFFKSIILLIPWTDKRTLQQIYKEHHIDPEINTIVLALTGGKRIPIPHEFDKTSFHEALLTMADELQPQGITISKNTIHHFEIMKKDVANIITPVYLNNQGN